MSKANKYILASTKESLNTISKLASIQIFMIIILLFYSFGDIISSQELTLGLIIMTLTAIPIRYFLFKDRPNSEKYTNAIEKIKASSFPSMHATRFTFLALFVSNMTKSIEVTSLMITLLIIIAYQRIYFKRHFISDIIGGVILGSSTFLIIVNLKGF